MSAEFSVVAERFTFFMAQSSALVTQHCHLMTLSALVSTRCGIAPPICFAVFRLMRSSNLVGRRPGVRRVLPFKEFVHVCRGGSVRRIGDITDKAPSSTASGLD